MIIVVLYDDFFFSKVMQNIFKCLGYNKYKECLHSVETVISQPISGVSMVCFYGLVVPKFVMKS